MIFPSAGERMALGWAGMLLLGFLKKKAMNRIAKTAKEAGIHHPIPKAKTATRKGRMRKGTPSLAMGQWVSVICPASPQASSSLTGFGRCLTSPNHRHMTCSDQFLDP